MPLAGGVRIGTRDLCGVWEVLEMESGVGLHKSVNIFNATELHSYKWLKR